MQTIGLADTLTIEPCIEPCGPGMGIELTTTPMPLDALGGTQNSIIQAYHRFWDAVPTGSPERLRVHLHKMIPVQAGLGGGSSNAAGMLRWLNQSAGTPLSLSALRVLAATLGADVPFFLTGGTAYCTEKGDQVSLDNRFDACVCDGCDRTAKVPVDLNGSGLSTDSRPPCVPASLLRTAVTVLERHPGSPPPP